MKTCCQTREIYVTPGDKARIATYTARRDLFVFARASAEYLDQYDDPTFGRLVFRPDGSRRVLVRGPDGACSFLGDAGCRLPTDTRPLVCRLYPFDYTEAGLRPTLLNGCPTWLLEPESSAGVDVAGPTEASSGREAFELADTTAVRKSTRVVGSSTGRELDRELELKRDGRGRRLLRALDLRTEDAERWRVQLYRELREEMADEDRSDLRPSE